MRNRNRTRGLHVLFAVTLFLSAAFQPFTVQIGYAQTLERQLAGIHWHWVEPCEQPAKPSGESLPLFAALVLSTRLLHPVGKDLGFLPVETIDTSNLHRVLIYTQTTSSLL